MTLRMRVLPRFPSKISGSTGIKIVRPVGSTDLVVSIDVSDIVRVPSVADNNKVFFLAWNSEVDTYSIMSFADTFAAVIDTEGFMLESVYDPQGKNADAFARANHTGTQAISTVSGLQAALDARGPASLTGPALVGRVAGTGDAQALNQAQANQVLGGWEVIASEQLNAVTAWSRTGLSAFRSLRLTAAIDNSVESGVLLRVSNDNGASYASGATAYSFASSQRYSGPTTTWNSTTANGASLQGGSFAFSVFETLIFEFNFASRFTHFFSKGHRTVSGIGQAIFETKSSFDAARSENALQLINVNGSAMSGFVQLEGIRG